jgi:predicted TIM-barrel fold metal-dependent hydrolase
MSRLDPMICPSCDDVDLGRRHAGGLFAGLLAGAMVPAASAATPGPVATPAPASLPRLDVHHHILPPVFRKTMGESLIGFMAPNRAAPQWTVGDSLAAMDRLGIRTAVVSAPPLWMNDVPATTRLARACNEFAVQMVADHPSRFGMFAYLPLPDVQATMAEIAHSFDTLKADGIGLMTNYGDKYLGDPAFAAVFDELNRRKAVVFVHPISCNCTRGLMPDLFDSLIEYPHDTTRTVCSLLFSGTLRRCPDIRFIFSHAGGTVPFLANRIAGLGHVDKTLRDKVPDGVLPALRKLYYDTAISGNAASMGALLKLVSADHVVSGSDFPFVPEPGIAANLAGIQQPGMSDTDLRAIAYGNVAGLLPGVAARGLT